MVKNNVNAQVLNDVCKAKEVSKWSQDALRRPHDGPIWPQDGPKMAQDSPKTAPRWPKMAPGKCHDLG